ncbi:MAG: hypothetical protein HY318_20340 [Armatimonadetes bacterium]|nr:hypothetical protein [Armatimonadota bacterium]
MKIFRYKKSATNLRVALILFWALVVVIPVALNLYPFDDQNNVELMVLLVLYSILPIIYCFYLVQVAQTAVITLDERSIGYHDRYTRIVARWNEILELSAESIRLQNGSTIFIKLGIRALDNWQDFQQTVIERAQLQPGRRRGNHIHRWIRGTDSRVTEVCP